MKKRICYSLLDNPPNYYRTGLTANDIFLVLRGAGPLSVTQVVGHVADKISPEAKARHAQLHAKTSCRKTDARSTEVRIASGCRDIVRWKLQKMAHDGKVIKHGRGKDARYSLVENEDAPAKKDSP